MANRNIKELLQKMCREGEVNSTLTEQIKECCFETATLENEGIHVQQKNLSALTEYLGFAKQDKILCLCNELCYRYAEQAFSEGFYAGLRIVSEIMDLWKSDTVMNGGPEES